jgi:hypothetical protein
MRWHHRPSKPREHAGDMNAFSAYSSYFDRFIYGFTMNKVMYYTALFTRQVWRSCGFGGDVFSVSCIYSPTVQYHYTHTHRRIVALYINRSRIIITRNSLLGESPRLQYMHNITIMLLYYVQKPVEKNKTSLVVAMCSTYYYLLFIIFFFLFLSRVGGRKGRRLSFAGGCHRPSSWSLSRRSHPRAIDLAAQHPSSAVTSAGSVRLQNRPHLYKTPHGRKSHAYRLFPFYTIKYRNILYYLNASQ